MTNKPLTRTLGVKGTLLFFVMLLSFLLVACGGGSNVPVGTPLYKDEISANNASPLPTEFVTEDFSIWVDPEYVPSAGIINVIRVEVRGCIEDAQGNPCVRYIRLTDIGPITSPTSNTPTPTEPGYYTTFRTFRSYGVPVLFLAIIFAGGSFLYKRLRAVILNRDKTLVIKHTETMLQSRHRTQLSPLRIEIRYRVSQNPGEKANYETNTQKVVEDTIMGNFLKALRLLALEFGDDTITYDLPRAVNNITEAQFPTTFLSSYGVLPDLDIIIGNVDFPQNKENLNKQARDKQLDHVDEVYARLNPPDKPEQISRATIYLNLQWMENPVGAFVVRLLNGQLAGAIQEVQTLYKEAGEQDRERLDLGGTE